MLHGNCNDQSGCSQEMCVMKKDATEKTLSELSKKVGQSVRAQAKSVKKTLIANLRKEMSHAKADTRNLVGGKYAGKT